MEATMNRYVIPRSLEDFTESEFYDWLNEGLKEAHEGRLLDFDTVFDELDERFSAYE